MFWTGVVGGLLMATGNPMEAYRQFLAKTVQNGQIQYQAVGKQEKAWLTEFLGWCAEADPARFKTDPERVGFWVEAYNATVISEIANAYPRIKSVKEVKGFFRGRRHRVGRQSLTLDEIEHRMLREAYRDPRIHFVLVCGAESCPPLDAAILTGPDIPKRLDDAVRRVVNDDRYVFIDEKNGVLKLSKLFDWYREDFLRAAPSLEAYLKPYLTIERKARLEAKTYRIEYLPYEWELNDADR